MKYLACCVVILLFVASGILSADEINSSESRASLDKVLKDYIGLYQRDTLVEWKKLFHPSVMVFFPADDGTINARNLDEFFQRQKNYFNTRKSVSERLENVQIFEGRQIARVVANYVFIDEGEERPGKLGLHLVEGNDGWKIVAVCFSYD
ncbi:MAG TPA: nuclear transport factor 2 family protein [Acidobacteriota bacterium]|nr:nuclear transport factor 2 family protein [Acidobacteriota bacterium]